MDFEDSRAEKSRLTKNREQTPTSCTGKLLKELKQLTWKDWIIAVILIALPNVGALVVPFMFGYSVFAFDKEWYDRLRKPSWQPPQAIFGPMWTLLYLMIGLASYIVLRCGFQKMRDNKVFFALACYAANQICNWAWQPLFFGAKNITWALVDICLILATLIGCIFLFWRYSRVASALMVPYFLWVTFATALNAKILELNKDGVPGPSTTSIPVSPTRGTIPTSQML